MNEWTQALCACCVAILLLAIGGLIDGIEQADAQLPVRIVADRTRHPSTNLPPRPLHASVQPAEAAP